MHKKGLVIITGANSGIGLETANYLLAKGYNVVGIDIKNSQEHFPIYTCDITNLNAVKTTFKNIEEKYGNIFALINNAGIGISGAIEHTKESDIKKIFDVNVVALINCCREIIPYLRSNAHGKIINISSVAGEIPIPFQACYSATKSAVLNFSMALNLEIKNFNIGVTAVLPGDTKTSFTKSRVKNEVMIDENYKDRIQKSIARMEKDEEHGMHPIAVAKVVYKALNKSKAPVMKTVGFSYKLIAFLAKILPRGLMLKIVKKLYG